jgi:hypothetical protein
MRKKAIMGNQIKTACVPVWRCEKETGKLVYQYYAARPCLHDLAEDISEQNDLPEKYPKIVSELPGAQETWIKYFYPDTIPRELKRSAYIFPEK